MEFVFTNEFAESKLDELSVYLLGPRLWIPHTDYPDFDEWADKAFRELKKQQKRAMIALHQNTIVGALVYQKHKALPDTLELKNLTVRPTHIGRYIASFLIRNTEVEGGSELNARQVVCDTKAHNISIRAFLSRHKYVADRVQDLYHYNAGDDIVYTKKLTPTL